MIIGIVVSVIVIALIITFIYVNLNKVTSPVSPSQNISSGAQTQLNNSCTRQFTDTEHMDIFDSHVHISPKVTMAQIITEMDAAGTSVANLYSGTLEATSKYPGRFILFVDTPDQPEPSTWLKQGQAFVTSAENQLKTGKYYGVGEANLRYYGGDNYPPDAIDGLGTPDIYVPADTPVWLQLVDLSAKYHVPISFHFVPDSSVANAAFERMLNHNKNAILIWAHLGFNNMPFDRTKLNDYLLRYPNLYFDTAGIQGMQNPLPQPNSNWARISVQGSGQQQGQNGGDNLDGGRLNEEWKQFFETWNSRILFATDAGGGKNSLERWLNYVNNTIEGATPDAVGHWRRLLSNLDSNAARNILSSNSRALFLKEQKPSYDYSVSSNGNCYHILVSSTSSVSALIFNQNTKVITFTIADSTGKTMSATITIPTTLVKGRFTAQVDGQNVPIKEESNSTDTTITLEYAGGINTIVLSVSPSSSS